MSLVSSQIYTIFKNVYTLKYIISKPQLIYINSWLEFIKNVNIFLDYYYDFSPPHVGWKHIIKYLNEIHMHYDYSILSII